MIIYNNLRTIKLKQILRSCLFSSTCKMGALKGLWFLIFSNKYANVYYFCCKFKLKQFIWFSPTQLSQFKISQPSLFKQNMSIIKLNISKNYKNYKYE